MAKLTVGANVDAWCSRCNLMLAHTIEAMVGDTIKRCHCNTCRAQHQYRGHAPGEGPARTSTGGGPRSEAPRKSGPAGHVRASDFENYARGRDLSSPKTYSPKEKFAAGDVVRHTTFGIGIATSLKDATKVEILFEDGPRVLIHGR